MQYVFATEFMGDQLGGQALPQVVTQIDET